MRALPFVCLLLAATAGAQTKTYNVELTGPQEFPPLNVSGIGQATVTVDTGTGAVTVNGTYQNLTTNAIAAHIHGRARRGMNAGVTVPLSVSGGMSGTFGGSGTFNPGQLQDLLDGLTYLNVHSVMHGGGEVRGQIDSVPGSGSGSNAPPVTISGPATAGGTLQIGCPPGIGSFFIVIGLPLPPCQTVPLFPPLACGNPTNLAINLIVTPLIVTGASVSATIPATLTVADIAIQCGRVDINQNCISLSAGHRVAIRP